MDSKSKIKQAVDILSNLEVRMSLGLTVSFAQALQLLAEAHNLLLSADASQTQES